MKWWKIVNFCADNAELILYGTIGDGWFNDNNAADFAAALQGLRHMPNITVRVNSSGGEATAAQAIYSLIKDHPAYVTIHIDGIAASAASLIVMAGDRIIMPANALMMIHNPVIYAVGDREDMYHAADILEKVKDTMLYVYSEKTGLDIKTLSEMMDNETWMSANEALEKGFVDEVDAGKLVNISSKGGKFIVNGFSVKFGKKKTVPAAFYAAANMTEGRMKNKVKNKMNKIKKKYPEIYNEILSEGAAAERNRITANNISADIRGSNVNFIPAGGAPESELAPADKNTKNILQKVIDAANANMKG